MLIALALSSIAAAHDCAVAPVALDGVPQYDLASALAAATPDAQVDVCPGTHVGPFVADVPVRLLSLGGSSDTTLDGDGVGSVLTLPGSSTVSGFTVTNGATTGNGGGIQFSDAGVATVADTVVRDNIADQGGGLYIPEGGEVVLTGSRIEANVARNGGGIFAERGLDLDLGDSVVEGNRATGAQGEFSSQSGNGGGLYLRGDAAIRGGTIVANVAEKQFFPNLSFGPPSSGGGVYAFGAQSMTDTSVVGNVASDGAGIAMGGGSLALSGVRVEDNEGDRFGGGVYCSNTATVSLEDSVLRHNTAQTGAGAYLTTFGSPPDWTGGRLEGNQASNLGGGIFVSGGASIQDVDIVGNVAQRYGGGIGTTVASPYFPRTLTLTDANVIGNEAVEFTGGGIDLGINAHLERVVVAHNRSADGGGLLLYGSTRTAVDYRLEDVEVRDNRATQNGGGIAVVNQASVSGDGVSVTGNRAAVGGGVYIEQGTTFGLESGTLGNCPDNLPEDVWSDAVGAAHVNYDEVEDLACDDLGCLPLPDPRDCVDVGGACVDTSAFVAASATLGSGVEVREEATVRDRSALGLWSLVGDEGLVGHDAVLGALVQVCDEAMVSDRAELADDVTIGAETSVGFDAEVGAGVFVGAEGWLADRSVVGDRARLGQEVVLGHDASVGAGAVLGNEVELGDRAVVGEGAVLGDEVVLANDAVVPAGAIVPAGTYVP